MAQIFHHSANATARMSIVIVICLVGFIAWAGYTMDRGAYETRQNEARDLDPGLAQSPRRQASAATRGGATRDELRLRLGLGAGFAFIEGPEFVQIRPFPPPPASAQVDGLLSAYRRFELVETKTRGEWAALVLRAPPAPS